MVRIEARPRQRGLRGLGRLGVAIVTLAALGLLAAVWFVARGSTSPTPGTRVIVLHAYSALDEALTEGLLPAFQQAWKQRTGEPLYFVTAFEGSGTLVERLRQGAEVHVAILACEVDALRLTPRAALPEAWRNLPHHGVLARTPVVLHVREGNPQQIQDFEDLTREGVRVLRPDARKSGLGAWALLAIYGAAWRESGNREVAMARLLALEAGPLPPAVSARAASRCFRMGVGDVSIVYAQDVAATPSRPALPGLVVRPRSTILCEPVVVVLRRNVPAASQDAMDAFVAFLWADRAQTILRSYGFLPPDGDPKASGIEDPFTLADLGGAEVAGREVLDRLLGRRAGD